VSKAAQGVCYVLHKGMSGLLIKDRCMLHTVHKGMSRATNQGVCYAVHKGVRLGHDVKLHPHPQLFVLMCHEAGQSAFLNTQLYLSTNLDHILFSNVSWH